MIEIGFKRLSEEAILPTKAYLTDSGWDLYSSEDVIIVPGETVVVKTNIALVLPEGYEAQVRPRSGITSNTKLRVQLGTIDNFYHGDIGIIIDNIKKKKKKKTWTVKLLDDTHLIVDDDVKKGSYLIRKGDRIAQLVVQALPQTTAIEVFDLEETPRGKSGFGSSGMRCNE